MKAPEHSPLPWRDDGFGMVDCNGNKVRLYGSGAVFSKELVNRRLVVRAVSSHDALLAAAKEVLQTSSGIANDPTYVRIPWAVWQTLKEAITPRSPTP